MSKDTLQIHPNQVQLCNAIKANDERSLKIFYQENYPKIEKYILNNHGSEEAAKDVYQDAFIALWRNIQLEKFKPENDTALSGYLFKISKNKWMDVLRSSHHKKLVALTNEDVNISHTDLNEIETEYLEAVKINFKKLGDNCKDVLSRFYYSKQSMKTIAATYDWTEATARNNKYRCLQRLRDMLKTQKN